MSVNFAFYQNINVAVAGASSSAVGAVQYGYPLATVIENFANGLYSRAVNTSTILDSMWSNPQRICTYGCDSNANIQSWQPNLRTCLQFYSNESSNYDYWNNYLAGKRLTFIATFNHSSGVKVPWLYFEKVLPSVSYGSGTLNIISDKCLDDITDFITNCCGLNYARGNVTNTMFDNNDYSWRLENVSSQCDDLRSSSGTSEFLITLNGINFDGVQESRRYNLLIQPDNNHTTGTINLGSSDELYSGFQEFIGASVRMLDNVCCHGAGYIDIYGTVLVHGLYWETILDGQGIIDDIYIPHVASLEQNNVLLLRARFDDECCCSVTGYTEEVTDLLNNYFGSQTLLNAAKEQIYFSVQPTSIVWNGFERLSDFCCDDSDCSDIDDYEYQIEYPEINTGGGGEVDISCICDGLTSLNSMLSSKLDSIVEGQGLINETLEGLDVNINTECICDGLDSIKDSLDTIKESIDDKVLSVDNTVNVSPCQPIVTNPVNNITVTPSTAEITVEPCSPVVQVTNPVNNITVTPSTAEITVEPCSPVVQVTNPVNNITVSPCQPVVNNVIPDTITVDNDTLNDKLDELFKKDDDTITDILDDVFKTEYQGLDGEMHTDDITEVIRAKQCENVVECIVEPVNMAYEGKGKYIDKDMLEQN